MIVMFIQGGNKVTEPGKKPDFDLISNQTSTMQTLLLCALVAIPSMLFVNPCVTVKSRRAESDEEDYQII